MCRNKKNTPEISLTEHWALSILKISRYFVINFYFLLYFLCCISSLYCNCYIIVDVCWYHFYLNSYIIFVISLRIPQWLPQRCIRPDLWIFNESPFFFFLVWDSNWNHSIVFVILLVRLSCHEKLAQKKYDFNFQNIQHDVDIDLIDEWNKYVMAHLDLKTLFIFCMLLLIIFCRLFNILYSVDAYLNVCVYVYIVVNSLCCHSFVDILDLLHIISTSF